MTARVRKALIAAAAASAIALSGCTASGWEPKAPPAAGTQAELKSRDKARNMLFVVDDSGKGLLAGQISSVDGAKVTGIRYKAEQEDGQFGEEQSIDFTADIARQKAVRIEQEKATVSDPKLTPGRNAEVTIDLNTGSMTLIVPVYSNEHPDYEKLWSEAA